jgi:FkbH-like protein
LSAEPTRLVIWDLDETFWEGTLTEGGIRYRRDNHDIVIELCRRGIMNAICSKNDFDQVRKILTREGIWDYFIFPSISWEAKGPRVQALIESIQLRAPTILYIDDNPLNRAEARHFVPELQVADETIIPTLLESPLCQGKNDSELTRLGQYKLLEKRQADAVAAGGDNLEFLRASNIRVTIEHDIEANIDRAIELINRTNQLNFTKSRLSEDAGVARAELRKSLGKYSIQAGLIGVRDRYGDYGYCGFYLMHSGGGLSVMQQFCFSCRILGMGVESWLYQRLGRPTLKVVGEVLTDVIHDTREIDWITIDSASSAAKAAAGTQFDLVLARGGCDLQALMHYFDIVSKSVAREVNTLRNGANIRVDHSMITRYGIEGLPAGALEALQPLGYAAEDFRTVLADPPRADRVIWVLSFWTDAGFALYRHRELGITVPVSLPMPWKNRHDMTRLRVADVPDSPNGWVARAVQHLKQHFTFQGLISKEQFQANLRLVLERGSPENRIFILLANATWKDNGAERTLRAQADVNAWLAEAAAEFENVKLLQVTDFVKNDSEIQTRNHFDRMVYFRIFEHIVACAAGKDPGADVALPVSE